jgi:hypothetical protein
VNGDVFAQRLADTTLSRWELADLLGAHPHELHGAGSLSGLADQPGTRGPNGSCPPPAPSDGDVEVGGHQRDGIPDRKAPEGRTERRRKAGQKAGQKGAGGRTKRRRSPGQKAAVLRDRKPPLNILRPVPSA